MNLDVEVLDFFKFFILGILITFIFDFFRAIRKYKKVGSKVVLLQDIIYFIIVIALFAIVIARYLSTEIRMYCLLAIILSSFIYLKFLSKHIIKLFLYLFKFTNRFLKYLLLPISLIRQIIMKIYNFFKKIVGKYCKSIKVMVLNICSNIKLFVVRIFKMNIIKFSKNKRGNKKCQSKKNKKIKRKKQ